MTHKQPEPIPEEALIMRGGRNQPQDLRRGTGTHPIGVTGVWWNVPRGCRWRNWRGPFLTGRSA